MVFPQYLLLLICILVPLYSLIKGADRLILAWIALTCSIDLFNSQAFMNLTAIKLAGLVLTPYIFKNIKSLTSSKESKLFLSLYLLMAATGIIFGHITPWTDDILLRSGRDIPQWRSILHLGSQVLELNVGLFLALKIQKKSNRDFFIRSILIALIIQGLSMILEFTLSRTDLHFDFYHFFTGGRAYHVLKRMRGFSYEPRGAAQVCAYGILFTLIYPFNSLKNKLTAISIFTISGFALTFSMTGFLTLFGGLGILTITLILLHFLKIKSIKKHYLKSLTYTLLSISLVLTTLINFFPKAIEWEAWKNNFRKRAFILQSNDVVGRFEVLDAAALNFFKHNPKYLPFGAGPGLVSIPATKYVLPKDKQDFPGPLLALPHMGAVLLISNAGIAGLTIWLLFFIFVFKRYLNILNYDKSYLLSFFIYTLFMLLYLLQIRYFYLIGIGFAFTVLINNGKCNNAVCNKN